MRNKKVLLVIPVTVLAITLGVVFYPQEAEAHGAPSYSIDTLNVYQDNTAVLGAGTAVCTGVTITSGGTCSGTMFQGRTYRIELTVNEVGGDTGGSPTQFVMQSAVGNLDVVGVTPSYGSGGCSATATGAADQTDWTPSTNGANVDVDSGTTCAVAKSGTEYYYFIVTLDADDADDDTSTFFITDGTNTFTTGAVSFTVDPDTAVGTPNVTSYDLYESESTTLGSGIAICTGVDADTAQTCGGQLTVGHTYRIEILVEETAGADFTATSFDLDLAVGDFDVLGDSDFVGVSNYILNSGCEDHTDWTESYVGGTDVRATAGTTTNCVINSGADANDEFWIVFRIHSSAGGAVNPQMTFTITDGSTPDTSASQTFNVINILE